MTEIDPVAASEALRRYIAARSELIAATGLDDTHEFKLLKYVLHDDGAVAVSNVPWASSEDDFAEWTMTDE